MKTLFDLVEASRNTYQPDNHYINFSELPEAAKKALRDAEVEVETSSYTVNRPMAFLRATVEFPDGKAHFEVSLAELSGYLEDEDTEEEEDTEERLQFIADEMKENFDWELGHVHFDADYLDENFFTVWLDPKYSSFTAKQAADFIDEHWRSILEPRMGLKDIGIYDDHTLNFYAKRPDQLDALEDKILEIFFRDLDREEHPL